MAGARPQRTGHGGDIRAVLIGSRTCLCPGQAVMELGMLDFLSAKLHLCQHSSPQGKGRRKANDGQDTQDPNQTTDNSQKIRPGYPSVLYTRGNWMCWAWYVNGGRSSTGAHLNAIRSRVMKRCLRGLACPFPLTGRINVEVWHDVYRQTSLATSEGFPATV